MKKIILIVASLTLFVTCKKDPIEGPAGPQGPQGPAGTGTTGVISGKTIQYDQHSEKYLTGLNTTTVSLAGTSFSAVTNVAGSYVISGVPAGIYDLVFTKPLAGVMQMQQVVFPGKDTLFLKNNIFDKATHSILDCYVIDSVFAGQPIVKVNVNVTPHEKTRGLLVLIGTKPLPDVNVPGSFDEAYRLTIPANVTGASLMAQINIPGGSSRYLKVYPYNNHFASHYYNSRLDMNIYPNAGPEFPTVFTISRP